MKHNIYNKLSAVALRLLLAIIVVAGSGDAAFAAAKTVSGRTLKRPDRATIASMPSNFATPARLKAPRRAASASETFSYSLDFTRADLDGSDSPGVTGIEAELGLALMWNSFQPEDGDITYPSFVQKEGIVLNPGNYIWFYSYGPETYPIYPIESIELELTNEDAYIEIYTASLDKSTYTASITSHITSATGPGLYGIGCNSAEGILIYATSTTTIANATITYSQPTEETQPVVDVPTQLYVMGHMPESQWVPSVGVEMTRSGNTFTASGITIIAPENETKGYFAFVTALGYNEDDWDTVNASPRYGAEYYDAPVWAGETVTMCNTDYSWAIIPGTYDIVADFDNMTMTVTETPMLVNAPVFTPAASSFRTSITVSISADPGCTIYYTADGSTPTVSEEHAYAGALTLSATTTLRAIAVDAQGNISRVASAKYTCTRHGIGEDYNPTSPPDPSSSYNTNKLYLASNPVGAGSFNYDSGRAFEEGETVYLEAYITNTGWKFVNWTIEGEVVSSDCYVNYVMPANDVTIIANYVYDPTSPSDPQVPAVKHPVVMRSYPSGACWFSPDTSFSMEENTSRYVYAYPKDGFSIAKWYVNGEEVTGDGDGIYVTMGEKALDILVECTFGPASPGNPGANYWNPTTGQLIIDDFTTGRLYSAIYALLNGNYSNVSSVVIKGVMDSSDLGTLLSFRNAESIDISRTSGITELNGYSFSSLSAATIVLPSTLTTLNYCEFYGCSNLTSIVCYALEPPTCTYDTFSNFTNKDNCTVYVPANSVAIYEAADYWKDFTILPITDDAHVLQVNLPEDCADGRYKNNSIEIVNINTAVRQKYVVTDRLLYTFNGLQKDEQYNVYLMSQTGLEIGCIENVLIPDNDIAVTFGELRPLRSIAASVVTPDGDDVTAQATVEWHKPLADGSTLYLRKAVSLGEVPVGQELVCRITLGQQLATAYAAPDDSRFTVDAGTEPHVITLAALPPVTLSGKVVDGDGAPLSGAAVAASQTFGGRYTKTFTTTTDKNGAWTLEVLKAQQTKMTYSANECITVSETLEAFADDATTMELPTVTLRSIVGARITYGFTYLAAGATEAEDSYSDYQNVSVTAFDVTQNRSLETSVQYPLIVVLDENVNIGDQIRLTATSTANAFAPVTATVTIGEDQRAEVTFAIVGRGGILAKFEMAENPSVVGMLYNAAGQFVQKGTYSEAELSFTNLADGSYTLVTMGESDLINTVQRLDGFTEIGLTEGTDYVKNTVTVESGKIATVSIQEVPTFDASLLTYTLDKGTNVSFNKSSITTGNYLTWNSKVDFKSVYKSDITNVALVVDLPEGCELVEQSVIQGVGQLPYTYADRRLTVQLGSKYTSQLRFCVIPTEGGTLNVTGYVTFDYAGRTIMQPIGTATATVKDLDITVPSTVASPKIAVSGSAPARSNVDVYAGTTLIGTGVTNSNGTWFVNCEIADAYEMMSYEITAKITTTEGITMLTETKTVTYNPYAPQVSKVTMYHNNPEMGKTYQVVFDFLNPDVTPEPYVYYIYNTHFTFTVEFDTKSPENISDVNLIVKTGQDNHYLIETTYDSNKGMWIAEAEFGNYYDGNIPVNVFVDYNYTSSEAINTEALDKLETDQLIEAKDAIDANIEDILNMEILSDNDDSLSVLCENTKTGEKAALTIEALDFEQSRALLSEKQFIFNDVENGFYCYYDECADEVYSLTIIDTADEYAALITIQPQDEASATNIIRQARANTAGPMIQRLLNEFKLDWRKSFREGFKDVSILSDFTSGLLDALGIGKYVQALSFGAWCDILSQYIDFDISMRNTVTDKMLAKCTSGKYRLTSEQIKAFDAELKDIESKADDFHNQYYDYLELYKERLAGSLAYDASVGVLTSAVGFAAKGLATTGKFLKNSKNSTFFRYTLPIHNNSAAKRTQLGNALSFAATSWFSAIEGTVNEIVNPEFADFTEVGKIIDTWAPQTNSEITAEYQDLILRIKAAYSNCQAQSKSTVPAPNYPLPDVKVEIDPSGFVYEAVPTNRVEGVQASIYYKETGEDMFGDQYENIILWDAQEYAQENPLFTDENGMYRWDVPQGLWQVKFEKDGYLTTYSEWLPVPPPQLDVNIAITQNRQPEVIEAHAYEEGVEVQFDKYMDPSTLTTSNIYVTAGGEKVEGEIKFIDSEVADPYIDEEDVTDATTRFVSRVRFVPAQSLSITTGAVSLTVSRNVLSYAGIPMTETYQQELDIEKEVQMIVTDENVKVLYGGQKTVNIFALSSEAAVGRTMHIENAAEMIATVDAESVTLDDEGKATITINGEIPGRTMLKFTIDDVATTGELIVDVVTELITAEKPTASRASGTAVYRGTKVELATDTKDGVIYFTTDGTCPCDENGTRRKYTVPIVINEDTEILAMTSVGNADNDVSEVATFNYTLKRSDMDYAMEEGWTWVSHNLETPVAPADLAQDENVVTILGQTKEVVRDPEFGLIGSLTELLPTESYKVETTAATPRLRLSDIAYNPATPINVNAGWNWLGYTPGQTMSVEEAFEPTAAEDLDIVVGQDGFAQYDGEAWVGPLQTLSPGKGYMYQSQSAKPVVYNTSIVSKAASLNATGISESIGVAVDKHAYPKMMCVIAELFDENGDRLDASAYQLLAFCGSECRGVGKVVNGMVMLSVYGNGGEEVELRAIEPGTVEQRTADKPVQFSETILGNVHEPYPVVLSRTTGVTDADLTGGLKVYVSNRVLHIKGIDCRDIDTVSMFNMAGGKALSAHSVAEGGISVEHLPVGTYIVVVKAGDSYTYHKVLVR